MIEVESGDVMAMRDAKYSSILDDINVKHRKWKLSTLLALAFATGGVAVGVASLTVPLLAVVAAIPGWLIGRWLDSYRRSAVLFYDLEPNAEAAYRELTDSFDAMNSCAGKWHIAAGGAIRDLTTWKQNAGASHIVDRKPTEVGYSMPTVIKSNVTPPSIGVGKQTIYFLPDVMLVEDDRKIGAIGYTDLGMRFHDSQFIEDGKVPDDATVIGQTWQHPNKNGGPDRRFANNRQIPICLYEVLHMTSASGLNEMVEFSRTGVTGPFTNAIRRLISSANPTAKKASRIRVEQTPETAI